jgi:hypothetical protein
MCLTEKGRNTNVTSWGGRTESQEEEEEEEEEEE